MSQIEFALFLESAVRLGIPLALAAMGETITERSGVINIGLEGSIIAGALGGALGAIALEGAGLGLAYGALAGLLVALVFAVFAISLGADQIITGTAVTIGGLGMTGAVYQVLFGANGMELSVPTLAPVTIPWLSEIPVVGRALFAQAPTAYFAYVMAPLAWYV